MRLGEPARAADAEVLEEGGALGLLQAVAGAQIDGQVDDLLLRLRRGPVQSDLGQAALQTAWMICSKIGSATLAPVWPRPSVRRWPSALS